MTSTSRRATRSRRRPGRVRAVLAAGTVLGIGVVATFAQFTDHAQLSASFTTGSVNLTFDTGADGTPSPYAFADWSEPSLSPGVPSYAALTVNNAGTLPFTYTMSTPALTGSSTALAGAMTAGIRIVTGECTAATYGESEVIVAENGPFAALAIETPRSLTNGTSETLCFMAQLPEASAETPGVQGQTINPVFTFDATQTTT